MDGELKRPFLAGSVVLTRKNSRYSALLEGAAVGMEGEVYYLGVVGAAEAVRGIGAYLGGAGSTASLNLEGVPLRKPDGGAILSGGRLRPEGQKYRRAYHRLGYGWVHATFISKAENFLASADEASLWAHLRLPKYTTPMLRGWMPHVLAELRRPGPREAKGAEGRPGLVDLYGLGCACALVQTNTKRLDAIIARACRAGAFAADFAPEPPTRKEKRRDRSIA